MGFKAFIKSRQFIISSITAIGIIGILVFGSLQFLSVYTRHGKEIQVPDLKKMKAEKAMDLVSENGFEIIIIDTIDYNPNFPPLTISDQDPKANDAVKEGRKIYVK
ncbi:MAG TPA: PASTA domain-containing protein, partial [Flavobacterium sp.]|nr:PASTA domain-containing protein [Flavobacterium sp.]